MDSVKHKTNALKSPRKSSEQTLHTAEHAKPKVGIYGPEYRRLLAMEAPTASKRYCEQYYSLHIPTGALCLTDHSYAGGYGGGYIDDVDELIEFDISYESFIAYCRKASPVLERLFHGITKQSISAYIYKIERLAKPKRLLSYVEEVEGLVNRKEFSIIKPICIYDSACVYLCRIGKRSMLVLETVSYGASPMVVQEYSILKEVDLNNSRTEDLVKFSDDFVRQHHIANQIDSDQSTCQSQLAVESAALQRYHELFSYQTISGNAWVSVVIDTATGIPYTAAFQEICVGGGRGTQLDTLGDAIDYSRIYELALRKQAQDPCLWFDPEQYKTLNETNWREFI